MTISWTLTVHINGPNLHINGSDELATTVAVLHTCHSTAGQRGPHSLLNARQICMEVGPCFSPVVLAIILYLASNTVTVRLVNAEPLQIELDEINGSSG